VSYAIVGHSEPRKFHCEKRREIKTCRARNAQAAGLILFVCVGETEASERTSETESV